MHHTQRQRLTRPRQDDVGEIFERFASDPKVSRDVAWRRHEGIDSTRAFIDMSDEEWSRWGVGPYLVRLKEGQLVGSTGLHLETGVRASTGYVFARGAWGLGHATESLGPHTDDSASRAVLEKCGFTREGILAQYQIFPNLGTSEPPAGYLLLPTSPFVRLVPPATQLGWPNG